MVVVVVMPRSCQPPRPYRPAGPSGVARALSATGTQSASVPGPLAHGPRGGPRGGAAGVSRARRGVREELGLAPSDVVFGERSVDAHGGWSYTTVLARPARPIDPAGLTLDGESTGVAWWPLAMLDEIEL